MSHSNIEIYTGTFSEGFSLYKAIQSVENIASDQTRFCGSDSI